MTNILQEVCKGLFFLLLIIIISYIIFGLFHQMVDDARKEKRNALRKKRERELLEKYLDDIRQNENATKK